MLKSKSHKQPDQRGSAIVETAIVMPVILMITMGIVQLSLIFCARSIVNLASFKAARAYLVWAQPSGIDEEVNDGHAEEMAKNAATKVLSTIAGPTLYNEPSLDGPIVIPGWGDLNRSREADSQTEVNVVDSDDKTISIEVVHHYELLFPYLFLPFAETNEGAFGSEENNGAFFLELTAITHLPMPWTDDTYTPAN